MLGGVCAGIADYFGWDRTAVRLLTVASIFLPGPQVLAYLVLWPVVPAEDRYWNRHPAPTPPSA
jgi:phage shock protein PspC (stress-responsive transcriptional regulator)